MLEHMWGDPGMAEPQRATTYSSIRADPPAVNRSPLNWRDAQTAQNATFRAVATRLSLPSLSAEQMDQVRFVFESTVVGNESVWSPESSEPAKLDIAVGRSRWFSDSAFRLKIYGEFAQVLYPQFRYDQLPMLSEQSKNDVKSLYMAILLEGRVVSHIDCINEALRRFEAQYVHCSISVHDRLRIQCERSARWSNSPAPAFRAPEWSSDGWR